MSEHPDNHDKTATFILLSYARPQNLQRIIDAMKKAKSCGRIILSNNQPNIDIFDYINEPCDLLEVIQQDQEWLPVKRQYIARECPGEYFLCIDDDVFLTPEQIDLLVNELINDPSKLHGILGENIKIKPGRIERRGGFFNVSCKVTVINRVYAFTRIHVRRFFEILHALGINDPRDLGPAEDIVLSFTGTGRPSIHDLGPLEFCPTSSLKGVAMWKENDFFERRYRLFVRLRSLATRRAGDLPRVNRSYGSKVARALRIAHRFNLADVWNFTFSSAPIDAWATIRDNERGLVYDGYVDAFSRTEETQELLLSRVVVYDNETGEEVDRIPVLYRAFPKDAVTVEFRKVEFHDGNADRTPEGRQPEGTSGGRN